MAEEKDVRSILAAIELEDGAPPSPRAALERPEVQDFSGFGEALVLIEKAVQATPMTRSNSVLPTNIRKALEESNLPIEQAVAIADLCEGLLPVSSTARSTDRKGKAMTDLLHSPQPPSSSKR